MAQRSRQQRTWEPTAGIMCCIPMLLCPMCKIGDMLEMCGTGSSMFASCKPLLPANCMPPCGAAHKGSGR